MYDLAVVGGGPAGAMAGATAARLGLKTLVVEAAAGPRWKPGESLPSESNDLLRSLGLLGCFLARADVAVRSAGVRSVWGSSEIDYRDGFAEPKGAGWIVDRAAFERLLCERAVAAGAEWRWGQTAKTAIRNRSLWRISFHARSQAELHAAFVIDATGRPARIARRLGARRITHTKQSAVVSIGRTATAIGRPWVNVQSLKDGWLYTAAGPDRLLVASRFGDRIAQGAMEREFFEPGNTNNGTQVSEIEWENQVIVDASTAALNCMGGDGWMAVGDAATAFDPISSQGLSQALASGAEGARVAAQFLIGNREAIDRYSARMRATYMNTIAGLQVHYRKETRWPGQAFWRRRQSGPID